MAAMQATFEAIVLERLGAFDRQHGGVLQREGSVLVLTGGCALNVKANQVHLHCASPLVLQ